MEADNIVKYLKTLISFIIVAAVLFASAASAAAIGFDAEAVYESVFVVFSGSSLGSGFAIGENCILTNAHVVGRSNSVTIMTYGGEEFSAAVLALDEDEDIAILCVKDASFPSLKLVNMDEMKTGDDIFAIGAPKGMAYTLTKGSISAKERIISSKAYIQIDAPINSGNSGGPLLNDVGEVLGMNTLKMSDAEGIGLAIPSGRIISFINTLDIQLDESGNVTSPIKASEEPLPPPTVDSDADVDDESDKRSDDALPPITYVAFIVMTLSLIGNVVQSIMFAKQKKQNISLLYDPRERTDFDIEILE